MRVKEFTVGELMSKSYIVSENKEAVIIDPGAEGKKLYDYIQNNNLKLKYIILTHGHFDHIAAVNFLKAETDAEILAHPKTDLKLKNPKLNLSQFVMNKKVKLDSLDRALNDGQEINLADQKIRVIYTPGHSEDGISLYLPKENILFSGDCIFANSVGRTDLQDSSLDQLINSIENKLFKLPLDSTFYPGHGPKAKLRNFKETVWPVVKRSLTSIF